MTRKLHPSARTNAALRREIQESSETNKALAARLGLNLKTIAKWRSRPTTSDARKGPRPASTVLSATEEALIVVFRKHTRFTLDVCLAHLKPSIPALSRSALHRCFKRYRVSRIPRGLAELPPKFNLGKQSAHFTIEVCAMPGAAGDYLYAAINQTWFVFAKVMKSVSPYDATDFLEDLRKVAPAGVSSVITSDHEAFGPPAGEPWEPKFPHRIHPFVKACRERSIGRTVEKSNNSTRMMVMKGWRDVELKVREGRRPRRSVIGLRGDFDAQTIKTIAEDLKDRPRERMLAVAAIFDGATREAAAMNANVTAQTVRDWVRRFNENGPDGLIHFSRPGNPPDHRKGAIPRSRGGGSLERIFNRILRHLEKQGRPRQ
jgi:Helix-turn-helix domain